ncbi:telomere repeats-binding bouquet formation protein 1 [Stigmatopora argus]
MEEGEKGNSHPKTPGSRAEKEKFKKNRQIVSCVACNGTGFLMQHHVRPIEGDKDGQSPAKQSPQQGQKGDKKSPYNERCAGCMVPFESVTSRTFASVLRSCRQKCDMHKALVEATDRYMASHRHALLELTHLDPSGQLAFNRSSPTWQRIPCLNLKNVILTPTAKGTQQKLT